MLFHVSVLPLCEIQFFYFSLFSTCRAITYPSKLCSNVNYSAKFSLTPKGSLHSSTQSLFIEALIAGVCGLV